MKVLSLFDGVSCGRLALERAGFQIKKYYASEIKETAIKVTMDNYPDTIQLGDVTELSKEEILSIGEIDIIMFGSPCSDLSQANKEKLGLKGDKSKLFYEAVRVLEVAKPTYFFMENVGSMNKLDREIITDILGVEPIRINSKLVSGQLRNRLYWTNIPNVKQPQEANICLQDVLDEGYTDRLKARCLLESDSRPLTTPVKMFHRYHSTGFTTLIFKDEQHYKDCVDHYDSNFKGFSAKEIDDFEGDLSVYEGLRYLSQTELERLQTVPEGYTNTLSRNEAAGVLGDGWTVDVITSMFQKIGEDSKEGKKVG